MIIRKSGKNEELKAFVRRFSEMLQKQNKQHQRNQINKIELNDIAKSSRVYPLSDFNRIRKFIVMY